VSQHLDIVMGMSVVAPFARINNSYVGALGDTSGSSTESRDNSGLSTFVCNHLLEEGDGIRAIQELLGHKDVQTMMVYTQVLNRGGRGFQSPLDRFRFWSFERAPR